jgi:antibiotic biosynthesis monooxygenase (ABM) superfamily enzyme
MIEHIVLFRFKDEVSESTKKQIQSELQALLATVPSLRYLSVGANFTNRNKGFEYGLVARFDDREGLDAYQVHPEHMRVVESLIRPAMAELIALDYECPSPGLREVTQV